MLVWCFGTGAQLDLELGQQAWRWDEREETLLPMKKSPFGGWGWGQTPNAQKEANRHFWTTIPSGDATCRDGVCRGRRHPDGEEGPRGGLYPGLSWIFQDG